MTKEQKAKIILDEIDKHAPTCINWTLEELWIKAIERGLTAIQEAEKKEGVKA